MGDQPGNEWTKIPNAILEAMPTMGDAELRVVLAIARKTIGYQKTQDVISLTQLKKMTGLGRRHIIKALNTALANSWIDREPAKRRGFCYRLVTLGNQSPKVTSNLRVPELVTLGNQSSPQLVTLGNTQKKESKERLKKERESRAPAQTNIDSLHEGVAIYKRLTGKNTIPPVIATAIAEKVTDCPRFEVAATAWIKAGYNPGSLDGIMDWYEHPEKMERRNGTHQSNRPRNAHPNAPSKHGYPIERPIRDPDDTS